MSHHATNWAITQRGLKPATKLVLFHLADRHNPDFGCFPSQQRLAEDCEMSRASINQHLALLEERGLLERVQRRDEKTNRQQSTRYLFAFEAGFDDVPGPAGGAANDTSKPKPKLETAPVTLATKEKPCPESRHGVVSRNGQKPCPENAESRVQNLDTNLVREPLRESIVCDDAANTPEGFNEFWEAHPRQRDRSKSQRLFAEAVKAGVTADRITKAAGRYRAENTGNKPMYLAYADNWLENRRWEDYLEEPALRARSEGVRQAAAFWAAKVKAKAYIAPTAISAEVAACMLANGLVVTADLRRVGVQV